MNKLVLRLTRFFLLFFALAGIFYVGANSGLPNWVVVPVSLGFILFVAMKFKLVENEKK